MMLMSEVAHAVKNGCGIEWIDFASNAAWNEFEGYVNKIYTHGFYITCDDDSDYAKAYSVVAWRLHHMWNVASNNDDVTCIVMSFAEQLHHIMREWCTQDNMDICYELMLKHASVFVEVFGIEYAI